MRGNRVAIALAVALCCVPLHCGFAVAQSASRRDARGVRAAFRELVAKARRSTVEIRREGRLVALGTIVRRDGLIVSKSSEATGALQCQLPSGLAIPVRVLARDDATDLVLLQVDRDDLVPVTWAEEAPVVGHWVAAVGDSPLPLAVGVVSTPLRAIPEAFRRSAAYLGVRTEFVDGALHIIEVRRGTAAERAGLRVGDVLIAAGGTHMDRWDALRKVLRPLQPGAPFPLRVRRGGEELELEATLGRWSRRGRNDGRARRADSMSGDLSERRFGFPEVVQHDAAIRPEECGGPLIDSSGRALGVDIARAGRVESYALSARLVREFVDRVASEVVPVSTGDASPPPERDDAAETDRAARAARVDALFAARVRLLELQLQIERVKRERPSRAGSLRGLEELYVDATLDAEWARRQLAR